MVAKKQKARKNRDTSVSSPKPEVTHCSDTGRGSPRRGTPASSRRAGPRTLTLREVVKLALSCNYCNKVRKPFLRAQRSQSSAAVTTAINQGGQKTNSSNKKRCFDRVKLGVGLCYSLTRAADAEPALLPPSPGSKVSSNYGELIVQGERPRWGLRQARLPLPWRLPALPYLASHTSTRARPPARHHAAFKPRSGVSPKVV